MVKGYVDEQNKTVFICPNCGFEKQFDASPFKTKKKTITIKCRCGNATEMEIEFRKHFRKKVELFGICLLKKNNKKCEIIVRDLSMQGIRFEFLHICSKYMASIDIDDVVEIEFKLDTKQEELITKRCIVRAKTEKFIGAKFQDDNFSKR
ncbi:MAG: PilZ domain-containing protein, partial [Desulfamplus sp.]|nr:PilZ domain-containing protein [Desulfamplus sp.]